MANARICCYCGTEKTSLNNLGYPHWRLKNEKRYCKKCYANLFEYTVRKKEYNKQYGVSHRSKIEKNIVNYFVKKGISRNKLKTWSKHIRQRDENKCQICGEPAVLVHHIFQKSKYPQLYLIENNGISLCKIHHDELHMKGEI